MPGMTDEEKEVLDRLVAAARLVTLAFQNTDLVPARPERSDVREMMDDLRGAVAAAERLGGA